MIKLMHEALFAKDPVGILSTNTKEFIKSVPQNELQNFLTLSAELNACPFTPDKKDMEALLTKYDIPIYGEYEDEKMIFVYIQEKKDRPVIVVCASKKAHILKMVPLTEEEQKSLNSFMEEFKASQEVNTAPSQKALHTATVKLFTKHKIRLLGDLYPGEKITFGKMTCGDIDSLNIKSLEDPNNWEVKGDRAEISTKMDTYKAAADNLIKECKTKDEIIGFLFGLLDDIDTADDMAKEDNILYREIAHRIQQRRWLVIHPECDVNKDELKFILPEAKELNRNTVFKVLVEAKKALASKVEKVVPVLEEDPPKQPKETLVTDTKREQPCEPPKPIQVPPTPKIKGTPWGTGSK